MGAIRYTAGLELRRGWRTILVLTVLAGVGGAVVLTLFAGARRADTSYQRFRDTTLAADVSVVPSESDPATLDATLDAIERLPQVAAGSRPVFPFVVPEGSGLYPFLDFNAISYPDPDDALSVDKVRVVDGRLPDFDRADEIALVEAYAAKAGLSVGDRVRFESYAPDQFDALFGTGDAGGPEGPRVAATVTGIVDAPDFLSERDANFLPVVFFTPAFSEEHAETIGMYPGGISARLHHGQADVPAFSRAVRSLLPDDDELEIQPASDLTGRIDDSLRVLVVGLLLCAGCAGLTALVAIGFAMARHLSRAPGDLLTMRALGMTSREHIGTSTIAMLPVALGGGALALALALLASPLMPVGIAREADPDLGLSFDPLVLGVGFVVVALAVVTVAGVASWRATTVASADGADASAAPRPFRRATPLSAPVARPLGVRTALDPGRGPTAVPVRAAALGAVLGVAGLVGAVVFAASLGTTVDRPARYGFPWDVIVAGFQGDRADQFVDDLREDPRVADLGVLGTGIAVVGARDMNVYAVQRIAGDPAPTIIEGRVVAGDDEVVLGAGTARELGVSVGDTVTLRGAGRRYGLEVAGIAALPLLDERSSVDIGAIVTPRVLRSVAAAESVNRDVVVGWAPGVDAAAATRDLEDASGAELFLARVPSDLDNLERVRALPWALAALLAAVAILAIGHAVVTTVGRRRRDLAVLRTLGFVDRDLSALVRWEGSTFAAIGIVLGIPLGVIVGRVVWNIVATGIGVDASATTPVVALLVIAAATVAVALLAAAVPARRARRVHPATTLAVAD